MENDLQSRIAVRKVEDISFWEMYFTGIKDLTPKQQKEFNLARYYLDKALLAAMQNQNSKLQLCLNTAKEHEVLSGVDFSSTYAKIEKYTSEKVIYLF